MSAEQAIMGFPLKKVDQTSKLHADRLRGRRSVTKARKVEEGGRARAKLNWSHK